MRPTNSRRRISRPRQDEEVFRRKQNVAVPRSPGERFSAASHRLNIARGKLDAAQPAQPGDGPPCIRHRPFAIAGDWHGVPWSGLSFRSFCPTARTSRRNPEYRFHQDREAPQQRCDGMLVLAYLDQLINDGTVREEFTLEVLSHRSCQSD